ncbi:MAG: transcriptional repressor [Spirochaetales bacterium]|nr:transcriptional repressor [Spirochaetales bacterium]
MRKTKQREVIMQVLGEHIDHPSADTIYEEVRKFLPRISLGTVYRNLEIMSESGSILKLETGGSIKRFDPNTHSHPHFRCVKCGSIEDLPFGIDSSMFAGTDEDWIKGRKVQSLHVEYTGLCADCNGNTKS